jgi:hypothetical protein
MVLELVGAAVKGIAEWREADADGKAQLEARTQASLRALKGEQQATGDAHDERTKATEAAISEAERKFREAPTKP